MDLDTALAHVGGDRELLAELVAIFLREYPVFLDSAKKAIQAGDRAALELQAHTFKGRLAFFGIRAMHDKAMDLESMARNGNLSGAMERLQEIERSMQSILPELENLSEKRQ